MTKEKALEFATQKVNVQPDLFVVVKDVGFSGVLCAMKNNYLYTVEYDREYDLEPAVYITDLVNKKVERVY